MSKNPKPDVVLYTTPWCPYCIQAKRLLNDKGIPFLDHDVANDMALRSKITQQTGHRTVPIIMIKGALVGGYSELAALASSGELETRLA